MTPTCISKLSRRQALAALALPLAPWAWSGHAQAATLDEIKKRGYLVVVTEEEIFARKSVDQINAERPLDDVLFDLDKSEIRDDAKGRLQKDADWMKKWTTTQMSVEGHCDSRGSAEYNLGLGNRRATAVKDYLVSLGVPAGRVLVVSKGKEQPFCNEENESCWSQNRRGHFVITGK